MDDRPELVSLATLVTEWRGHHDPLVISEDATPQRIRDTAEILSPIRGIMILRGESLRDVACQHLTGLIGNVWSRSLVLVTFLSKESCAETMASWPPELKDMFLPEPLEWPRIQSRRADVPGIIREMCAQCVSQDGSVIARLSDEATDVLLRDIMRDNRIRVASVRSRIRRAFDLMLRDGESIIAAQHMKGRTSDRPRATPSSQPSPA
ncbi:MAG: hypothetical protein V1745_04285 [Patescibacteria group bacterium]